jgi:hypothetical protein
MNISFALLLRRQKGKTSIPSGGGQLCIKLVTRYKFMEHASFTMPKADVFSFAGVSAANEKIDILCDLGVFSEAGVEV